MADADNNDLILAGQIEYQIGIRGHRHTPHRLEAGAHTCQRIIRKVFQNLSNPRADIASACRGMSGKVVEDILKFDNSFRGEAYRHCAYFDQIA